jgi:protein SDA1
LDVKSLEHRRTINKKTKSGEKKLAKGKKAIKKKKKEKEVQPNFPALQLINDPQTFGEKLYDNLVKYGMPTLISLFISANYE